MTGAVFWLICPEAVFSTIGASTTGHDPCSSLPCKVSVPLVLTVVEAAVKSKVGSTAVGLDRDTKASTVPDTVWLPGPRSKTPEVPATKLTDDPAEITAPDPPSLASN